MQSLLHKGVNHLIENHAMIRRKTLLWSRTLGVCSIFLKQTRHGCMCAIYPSIWMKHLDKKNRNHYFEEVTSFLSKQMSCKELRGSLNFIKRRSSSFHILYVSAYCFLKEDLVYWFEEVKSLKKWKYKKQNRKAELHQRLYCIVPHIVWFCRNTTSYLKKYHQGRL